MSCAVAPDGWCGLKRAAPQPRPNHGTNRCNGSASSSQQLHLSCGRTPYPRSRLSSRNLSSGLPERLLCWSARSPLPSSRRVNPDNKLHIGALEDVEALKSRLLAGWSKPLEREERAAGGG